MCGPLLIPLAVAAISAVGTGVAAHMSSISQGQQADKAAQDAAAAKTAAGTAQKATAADTSSVNSTNGPATAGVNSGPASTLLTGAGGVSNNSLNLGGATGLGSNTLLGS
jgi:hypothetical protein